MSIRKQNFNQLTPAETERLALLAEECAEIIHVVGKILRHGYESSHPNGGPTNRHLLEDELGHAAFAEGLMKDKGDIDPVNILTAMIEKRNTVKRYLHHQKV